MVSEFFLEVSCGAGDFGAFCGAGAFGVSCGAGVALAAAGEEAVEESELPEFELVLADPSAFRFLLFAIISRMAPKIAGEKNPMVSNSAGPLLKSMNSCPVMIAQSIATAWIT